MAVDVGAANGDVSESAPTDEAGADGLEPTDVTETEVGAERRRGQGIRLALVIGLTAVLGTAVLDMDVLLCKSAFSFVLNSSRGRSRRAAATRSSGVIAGSTL